MTTPERITWARSARAVLRDVSARGKLHRLNDSAAGLSFWAILSIFPTVLAFASVLGSIEIFIGKSAADTLRTNIIDFLNRTLPPDSEITTTVTNILNQSRASLAVVGFLSAVWGMSKGFAGLVRALTVVDGRPEARKPIVARIIGIALGLATVILTTIVLLQIVVGPLLGFEKDLPSNGSAVLRVWDVVRWPVLAAVIVAWLATLYHVAPGPDRRMKWRDRLPGATLTMVAWVAVTLGFRFYVNVVGGANPILGVLGAVIVSLTWLYLLCLSTLYGAELNAAIADRRAPAPVATTKVRQRAADPAPDVVGAGVVAASLLLTRRRTR